MSVTTAPTVTLAPFVTVEPPRKCALRTCVGIINHLGPRAKYCDNEGVCKQAAWRDRGGAASGPSGLYVVPKVTDAVEVTAGKWRVTFDDGRQVEVTGASKPHARTRARWAIATKRSVAA